MLCSVLLLKNNQRSLRVSRPAAGKSWRSTWTTAPVYAAEDRRSRMHPQDAFAAAH
jgi:hypothetical protein